MLQVGGRWEGFYINLFLWFVLFEIRFLFILFQDTLRLKKVTIEKFFRSI